MGVDNIEINDFPYSGDQLPHALLFTGVSLAQQVAQLEPLLLNQLCIDPLRRGCGQCQACQWIKKRQHPDILWLPSEPLQSIKMEDIRLVITHIQQSSHQGNIKIVVLAPAEAMVNAAHQALLKTLEEPPARSCLILLSEYPGLLPATLRSRCQRWILKPSVSPAPLPWMTELQQTLISLQQHRITIFKAAELWQRKAPLGEILNACYFIAAHLISQQLTQGKNSWQGFLWFDEVNRVRQQLLRKLNPNPLLVLEYIFQQWLHAGV